MPPTSSLTQPVSSAVAPSWVQRHPLSAYFAIACAGTWALTIPIALSTEFKQRSPTWSPEATLSRFTCF